MVAVFGVEWFGVNAQQFGQGLYGGFTAGRALVDVCFTGGDGFRIRAATRIGTLATLGLGQQGIDLLDDRVAFDLKRMAEYPSSKPNRAARIPMASKAVSMHHVVSEPVTLAFDQAGKSP